MNISLPRLNTRGFSHVVLPFVVIAGFAVIGTYLLVASHADAPTPVYNQYVTVSTKSVNNTLSRGNPKNMPNGYIFGPGFNITGVQQTSFELYANTPSQGVGFYTVSGGLGAGQKDNIQTYVNPNKADGVYTGNYTLKYYDPSTQQWYNGPVISYEITLVDHYYTDYIQVSNLNTTVTLSKSKMNPQTGLITVNRPTVTALQNSGFEVDYNQPTQGQGFYLSSGGLQSGQTDDLQAYINASKPIGTYTGSADLEYMNSSDQWVPGPTITYTINLTN